MSTACGYALYLVLAAQGCTASPGTATPAAAPLLVRPAAALVASSVGPVHNAEPLPAPASRPTGATEPAAPTAAPSGAGTGMGPERWERAYEALITPEPVEGSAEAPWADCATTLAREPLVAENSRRIRSVHASFSLAHDHWRQAKQPIDAALATGIFVKAPEATAVVPDPAREIAVRFREAAGEAGSLPCFVIDIGAVRGKPSPEEGAAAKAHGGVLSGPTSYVILCAMTEADADPTGNSAMRFLVTVPSRFVAPKVAGASIVSWRFEPEGYLAEALRGRLFTVGRGDQLTITGVGRVQRLPRNPGVNRDLFRGTEWGVDFQRSCPVEGQGCVFNDGASVVTVAPVAVGGCAKAQGDHVDGLYAAWLGADSKGGDATLLEGRIALLAPDSREAKQVVADQQLRTGDLASATTSFSEVKDADGLARVAQAYLKTAGGNVRATGVLGMAVSLEPRSAWVIQVAGLEIEQSKTAEAKARLRALVESSSSAADLKASAALLKYIKDPEGAARAEAKAKGLGGPK